MEKLEKIEGKYYTQNIEVLPIEERVFFTQGKVANVDDFRFATDDEVAEWKECLKRQEDEFNQLNADTYGRD